MGITLKNNKQVTKNITIKGTGNALTKPTTAPSATQLVAVDNTNTQTMLNIGDGLSIENGSLKASGGGTGGKLYYKRIDLEFPTDFVGLEGVTEIRIYFYESNDTIYDINNISTLYERVEFAICNFEVGTKTPTTPIWILGCALSPVDFDFYCLMRNSENVGRQSISFDEIDGTNVRMYCYCTEV